MQTLHRLINSFAALLALFILTSSSLAAEPGLPYPASSEISDQKTGSVLIYNAYTSAAVPVATHDTHFSITNTSQTSAAFVHLFFVDGETCSVADSFMCLTACQIACFHASDLDPGVSGYLVAVAVDSNGCPVSHNFLAGSARVRYASGHEADLGAEAIAALYTGSLPGCTAASVTAAVAFDGISYNRVPRVLMAEPILSAADADQLLLINRIGGDLTGSALAIGPIFGILATDDESKFSFSLRLPVCQARLRPTSIRTAPPISTLLTAGRCATLTFWGASDDVALLGCIFTNTTGTARPLPFSSGKNLHKKTLTDDAFYVVPVFPPFC